MKVKSIVFFLITTLLIFSSIPIIEADQPSGEALIEIKIKNDFRLKGQNLNLTIATNETLVNVLIYAPSEELVYNKIWEGNESRLIPIRNNAEYGIYRVEANTVNSKAEALFTVLHIGDWEAGGSEARDFNWLNVRYKIETGWILNITGPAGGNILWGFKDLRDKAQAHDMNSYLLKNEHTVMGVINKTGIGEIKIYLFKPNRGLT